MFLKLSKQTISELTRKNVLEEQSDELEAEEECLAQQERQSLVCRRITTPLAEKIEKNAQLKSRLKIRSLIIYLLSWRMVL